MFFTYSIKNEAQTDPGKWWLGWLGVARVGAGRAGCRCANGDGFGAGSLIMLNFGVDKNKRMFIANFMLNLKIICTFDKILCILNKVDLF